jgi:hypothetical protein
MAPRENCAAPTPAQFDCRVAMMQLSPSVVERIVQKLSVTSGTLLRRDRPIVETATRSTGRLSSENDRETLILVATEFV